MSSGDDLEIVSVGAGGSGAIEFAVRLGPTSEAIDGATPMLVKKAMNEETGSCTLDCNGLTVEDELATLLEVIWLSGSNDAEELGLVDPGLVVAGASGMATTVIPLISKVLD